MDFNYTFAIQETVKESCNITSSCSKLAIKVISEQFVSKHWVFLLSCVIFMHLEFLIPIFQASGKLTEKHIRILELLKGILVFIIGGYALILLLARVSPW